MSAAMKSPWFATENEIPPRFPMHSHKICIPFSFLPKFLLGWVVFLGVACYNTQEEVRLPAEEIYNSALENYEDNSLQEAQVNFEKVIEENPGTRLATVSYLKLGDLYLEKAEWDKSETNYQTFLTLSPNSHLVPYVLKQLIALNYERNHEGGFFVDDDFNMEPNRKIIQEYQRFFFLYPQNAYLPDVKKFLHEARHDLAKHEFSVGNFYFKNKAFDAAILRYLYLLKTYSTYPQTQEVGNRLVQAYEANQQPHLAQEMKKAMAVRFSQDSKK